MSSAGKAGPRFDVAASSDDRRVRIGDLFGRDLLEKLRAVERVERPGMAASGYLLPVEEARKSRRGQYLFLNGRPVEDRVVWRALEEGFRGALPAGRHPVAWMWIEMDPLLVDVNVHPAKREVRFHRPAELRALVLEAVERALRPRSRPRAQPGRADSPVREEGGGTRTDEGARSAHGRSELLEAEAIGSGPTREGREVVETSATPVARAWRAEVQTEITASAGAGVEPAVAPAFRVIGVLGGRYVVLEASDGLVVLEGEAARERILYESFLAGAERGAAESQGLLVPVLLELEARDADVVLRNSENFSGSGDGSGFLRGGDGAVAERAGPARRCRSEGASPGPGGRDGGLGGEPGGEIPGVREVRGRARGSWSAGGTLPDGIRASVVGSVIYV